MKGGWSATKDLNFEQTGYKPGALPLRQSQMFCLSLCLHYTINVAVLSSGCRNCLQKVYNLTTFKLNKDVFQHFKNLIQDKLNHKMLLLFIVFP